MEHESGFGKTRVRAAVEGISKDGIPQVFKVNPDLMGSACFGSKEEQGIFSISLYNFKIC